VDNIGRYQLRSKLATGGMAEVYLAFDSFMAREVTLKLLPMLFMHDPTFEKRFEREARLLAQLEHPAIVPVYDFGYHDEQPYMVNRFMRSGSLLDKIVAEGRLSLGMTLDIVLRICSGLAYAHQKGIIHRDLKPANILFDDHENAYIADFGIAKLAESTSTLTGNALIGTPAYMSPEQFTGTGEIDSCSDQYSLGIMLFEMLSGELPFKGDTTARLMKGHLMDPPPQLCTLRSELPQEIEPIIQRMLSKKPDERYPSINGLTEEFERIKHVTSNGGLLDQDHKTRTIDQLVIDAQKDNLIKSPMGAENVKKDIYATNIIMDTPPQKHETEGVLQERELKGAVKRKRISEERQEPTKSKLDLPFIGAFWVIILGELLNQVLPYGFLYIRPLMIVLFFAIKTRSFQTKRILSVFGINLIISLTSHFGYQYLIEYLYTNRFQIYYKTLFYRWEHIFTMLNLLNSLFFSSMTLTAVYFYRKLLDLRKWKRILVITGPLVFSMVFFGISNILYSFWYDLFYQYFLANFSVFFTIYFYWLTFDLGILLLLIPIFRKQSIKDPSEMTTTDEKPIN